MVVASSLYLAGFFVSCFRPVWFYYVISVTNLALLLILVAVVRGGPERT
jgi:hypothetical protein